MKFGYVNVSVDPLTAIELGEFAEKSGFHTLWLPDHFVDVDGDKVEPWTVLSALAMKTRKIRLASSVTDTQRSHPARTAHAVACLDVISHGRAVLGIGAGEAMNIIPFGLPWDSPRERVVRLTEAIQVIRLLWKSTRENPTSFTGTYYSLKNAFLSQRPHQTYPPIYVGAFVSPRALAVVGEFGDGWHSWINTPDTFRRSWTIVENAAKSAGRDAEKIDSTTHLMVANPRNSEEKKQALLAGKATLLMEKNVLKSLGYSPELEQYQHLMVLKQDVARVMAVAEQIPDELVYRTMAIGGADEVIEKMQWFAKSGVKHLAVTDLLAPKTAKRTLTLVSRIMKKHRH
jgi:phthiodiolone/phenolphthiodiolone dimycocerosates ketoreductase